MMFWQSFAHDKSSSISQSISGKSRNLQKLLWYLSGIVTSLFKTGTGGCGGCVGWFPSWSGSGCDGLSGLCGDFPTIFVL